MVLPLIILVLLVVSFTIAVPTSTSLDPTLHSLSKRNFIRCFQNPSNFNIAIPLYSDCHKAVQLAYCDHKTFTVPMSFSTDPKKGFELPQVYAAGTCQITVGLAASAVDGDTGTIAQIAEAAIEIVVQCVRQPPNLGGLTTTGENDDIQVLVTGRNAPQQQPVPLYAQCMSL